MIDIIFVCNNIDCINNTLSTLSYQTLSNKINLYIIYDDIYDIDNIIDFYSNFIKIKIIDINDINNIISNLESKYIMFIDNVCYFNSCYGLFQMYNMLNNSDYDYCYLFNYNKDINCNLYKKKLLFDNNLFIYNNNIDVIYYYNILFNIYNIKGVNAYCNKVGNFNKNIDYNKYLKNIDVILDTISSYNNFSYISFSSFLYEVISFVKLNGIDVNISDDIIKFINNNTISSYNKCLIVSKNIENIISNPNNSFVVNQVNNLDDMLVGDR